MLKTKVSESALMALTTNIFSILFAIYTWIAGKKYKRFSVSCKTNEIIISGKTQIEKLNIKYDGYITRQKIQVEQFKKLEGVVPSRFIRGNHDTPLTYIKNFPYSEYKDEIEGSYDGTMRSTYQFITLGGQKYMLLVLDSFADAFLLNWANDVVEDNPDCKVIVATHAYLDRDGTLFESSEAKEATGDIIWDRFAKKHKNIVLILSGHVASDRVITRYTKGDNGNTVTQMLINPQMTDHSVKGGGFVAMLYFKKGSDEVQVEYYSTAYDKYYFGENQYTINIDMY